MEKARTKFVYNRKKITNKEVKSIVELRITYNRISKYISSDIFLYPDE